MGPFDFSTSTTGRDRLPGIDADILELVRQERVLEAARLSSARGDARGASALFERACDWRSAGAAALQAGDPVRALDLALRAGDDALAQTAVRELAADPGLTRVVTAQLARQGQHSWAAFILERAERHVEAAHAWERAGKWTRAARLFERAGDPARATRALEAALRRDPGEAEAALRLGALLVRFRKDESALRALQRVSPQAPERREALSFMVGALERLGFMTAASYAAAELSALGGTVEQDESRREREEETFGTLYGRYEVVRQVASSPRARLLEAFDRATGTHVAIKLFAGDQERGSSAGLARFEDDMRALRALDHPAIVPIRDFHREGPTVVLAWMKGGSVERLLSHGTIAPARAVEIACSILSALGAAHRLGVLHRDVKAANVLFDAMGGAHLSDFGGDCMGDASATATAGDFGALASLSPEQRDGHEVTARSDIFAVGVLLLEMLNGQKPSLAAERSRPSDAHHGLGSSHDAALARMTAQEASARPGSAREACELLLSLHWPGAAADTESTGERLTSGRPIDVRLAQHADGRLFDTWTGRDIERVTLADATLTRARAFARADHRALQPVLRVDREGGFIWLAGSGTPLMRALASAELARLTDALSAVQSAGGPAADVNSAHVTLDGAGEVLVAFEPPRRPRD